MSWVLDIEDTVFTLVKTRANKTLLAKYPKIFWTTDIRAYGDSDIFPSVLIHEMGGVEKGNTLDGKTTNAYLSTFEVRVTVNTKKVDAREISSEVLDAVKCLGFEMVSSPILSSDNGMYVAVSRYRRMIGQGDKLN